MDSAERSIDVDASPDALFAVLLDYEAMPDWQSAVIATDVRERDEQGRGTVVAFRIDVKVAKLRYVNRYTYDVPRAMGVEMIEGDMKSCETTYTFDELGNGRTRVTQRTTLDAGRFVPGPIKRLVAGQVLGEWLTQLKARAEAQA
ncbi:MAG TPA: SRPBCC family protein [Solirubrobacteraceae bacterium]